MQHAGLLDLDGQRPPSIATTASPCIRPPPRSTSSRGAALGSDTVSAEGPFGTLDAMGFTRWWTRASVIQFTGPARLVLNGRNQ